MKLCAKCGLEKPKEDFNWKNKAKGWLSSWCRECNKEYRKEHYKKNKEQILEDQRKYYKENKERRNEYSKKYRKENKEKERKRSQKYRQENKEQMREYGQKYYQENKEKFRGYERSRRARKRCTVPNNWVKGDEIKGRCYWCGDAYGDNYHLDHIMPLSLHGPHEEYNIVKTCPTCNYYKGNKHPLAWIADLVTT